MDEDLKLWRRNARNFQQSCCNSLGDRFYDRVNEQQLYAKVGFAFYNAPLERDEQNNTAVYTKAQQYQIKLVCDKVQYIQQSDFYYISYVYIVIKCKNNNECGVQVLFRVPRLVDGKFNLDNHVFIDPKPRIYETWGDYLRKNKLPKCYMCFPLNGIYTMTEGSTDLGFCTSPACNTSAAVFLGLDISSTVLMIGATGVTLTSLALPMAAPLVWGATATIFATGSYETARNVYRLNDIKQHGESLGLKNPDSRSAWLNLAGSVVGMASIGTTAIAKGVTATESAISRAGIITLRVLNISSLAVSGLGIINGVITLVMKRINGTLEPEDIMQFTCACLFFVNAVVSFKAANRLIEQLASSDDLTNLFNLRENASFSVSKGVVDFNDPTTYNALHQLVVGAKSFFTPDFGVDNLDSMILKLMSLLIGKASGKLGWEKFLRESTSIVQRIWMKYENVILKVLSEMKSSFEVSYWQQLTPRLNSNNLEIPRTMFVEIDRVTEFCGVAGQQRDLVAFARAFSTAHGNPSEQEFVNRFRFYCDCIIAQYKEEKQTYENELDTESSKPDFNQEHFDQSCGIRGNKNEFYFNNALNKVNHPDFLSNIGELYEHLQSDKNNNEGLPYLQTPTTKMFTFSGPVGDETLSSDYYWRKAASLSGYAVNARSSTMTILGSGMVVIEPNNVLEANIESMRLAELQAILIYSRFIDNCHLGLVLVIGR